MFFDYLDRMPHNSGFEPGRVLLGYLVGFLKCRVPLRGFRRVPTNISLNGIAIPLTPGVLPRYPVLYGVPDFDWFAHCSTVLPVDMVRLIEYPPPRLNPVGLALQFFRLDQRLRADVLKHLPITSRLAARKVPRLR